MMCLIADQIHYRGPRPARVVQVRQSVCQSRSAVQKGGGRLARDPALTIGCADGHALRPREHGPHGRDFERADEMHLAGARIREADLDA